MGEFYYAEIEAQFSKNHRNDDEGNYDERGATIAFRTAANGFNPGEYIENAEKFAKQENPFFFQRPKKKSSKFDIHNPDEMCYFEMQKVGKHMVASMLPKVCRIQNSFPDKKCTRFFEYILLLYPSLIFWLK